MRLLLTLVPAILLAAPLARAQDPQKVTLAWKFTKGEVNRYEMTQKVDSTIGEMEVKQEMAYRWALETKEVAADGTATMDMKYERVMMRMSGMMELEYDSDKKQELDDSDPSAAMAKMMSGFVGKSITLKMATDGKIVDVTGFDKILDGMGEGAEPLKQMMNEGQLKQMMQAGFAMLPDKAVGVGDKWEHKFEFDVPVLGKMKTSAASSVKSVANGGKTATIRSDMKITVDAGEGGMLEISDAKAETETVWSVADGRMESMSGTTKMKMSMAGQEFDVVSTMAMKRSTGKPEPGTPTPTGPPKKKDE